MLDNRANTKHYSRIVKRDSDVGSWTFLSNHALVLITVAADPDIRVRQIALDVGITERAAQRIVGELEEVGALVRERVGRRNH